jgi:hypothetical protein
MANNYEEETEGLMLPPLERRKERKYAQGPKLRILPSQLERMDAPTTGTLANMYESFAQIRSRDDNVTMPQDRILEEATAAERRALFPIVAPGSMLEPETFAVHSLLQGGDDDSLGWFVEGEDGDIPPDDDDFRSEQPDDDFQEDSSRRREPDDSWKKAYDPWNVHESTGFNKKKPVWGSKPHKQKTLPAAIPRRAQVVADNKEKNTLMQATGRRKRSKTALGIAGEGSDARKGDGDQQVDLHKVLELAETMLIGNTVNNRLESSLWGGTEDLTMPYVRINQDDVLEIITQKKGGELRRMKWNEHAEARVCGVLAMKGLMARHQAMKQSKQDLEEQLAAAKKDVRHSRAHIYAHAQIYTHTYIYTRAHIHTHAYIYTRKHIHTHIYAYTRTHTYTRTHIHTRIHIYTRTHIYTRIHIQSM